MFQIDRMIAKTKLIPFCVTCYLDNDKIALLLIDREVDVNAAGDFGKCKSI